jgi:hypothetical protein
MQSKKGKQWFRDLRRLVCAGVCRQRNMSLDKSLLWPQRAHHVKFGDDKNELCDTYHQTLDQFPRLHPDAGTVAWLDIMQGMLYVAEVLASSLSIHEEYLSPMSFSMLKG